MYKSREDRKRSLRLKQRSKLKKNESTIRCKEQDCDINSDIHSELVIKEEQLDTSEENIHTLNSSGEESTHSNYIHFDVKEEVVHSKYANIQGECSLSRFITNKTTIKSEDLAELHTEVIIKTEEVASEAVTLEESCDSEEKLNYKCDQCGKTFHTKNTIKNHTLLHLNYRPFKCDKCGKRFNMKGDLKKHSITHTDAKPFKCDKCEKSFNMKGNLKKHGIIHSDRKPFKCDQCDRAFARKADMKKHFVSYADVKLFKCDICGGRFKTRPDLKVHLKIHFNERQYKCDVCDKSFNYKAALKLHVNLHTGSQPHKCDKCNKKFNKKQALSKHYSVNHNT